MNTYFLIYKPYQVLSQFSSVAGKRTLADFFKVPRDVYPVGRLDDESEGLLLLSNDPLLNNRLLNPKFAHEREYWVQVDGAIHQEAIMQLQKGVNITIEGKMYTTQPSMKNVLKKDANELLTKIKYRKLNNIGCRRIYSI